MTNRKGVLYVVATPIGNLQDISARAIATLKDVSRIAAEDTRHSARLLSHFGIDTPMVALHEHNEREITPQLLDRLAAGDDLALISDAGTPLISDPGFCLVRAARAAGFRLVPVPGAAACIAALSVAGLPADHFVFEGFLPARATARRRRLEELGRERRTLVFHESSHRIVECLADMAEILGGGRSAVIARELTKMFETIESGVLAGLLVWLQADPNRQKGEFVVLVQGSPGVEDSALDEATRQVLAVLVAELPLKQAASLAAKITGLSRNELYAQALEMQKEAR
ncbi:MAG: 16S rRNA (cytidine(1402)-2'-O)-methyltransferase [Gammaproteobacteria bacterium]